MLIVTVALVEMLAEQESTIAALEPIEIPTTGGLEMVIKPGGAVGFTDTDTLNGASPLFVTWICFVAGTTGEEGVMMSVLPGTGTDENTGPPAHTSVNVTSRFEGSEVEIVYMTVCEAIVMVAKQLMVTIIELLGETSIDGREAEKMVPERSVTAVIDMATGPELTIVMLAEVWVLSSAGIEIV